MAKLAVALVLLSGCSIALQSKPKTAPRDCSTTHGYWIADAVGVAAGVAAMAFAVVNRNEEAGPIAGGAGAIGSVAYLASAGNGYSWRRQCAAGDVIPTTAAR